MSYTPMARPSGCQATRMRLMANTLLVSCRGRSRPGLETMQSLPWGLMQLLGTHVLTHLHQAGAQCNPAKHSCLLQAAGAAG